MKEYKRVPPKEDPPINSPEFKKHLEKVEAQAKELKHQKEFKDRLEWVKNMEKKLDEIEELEKQLNSQ